MENASKALLMAGAVLLALIIVSIGVYEFFIMKNRVTAGTNLNEEEIRAFNSKIMPYIGEKTSGSQVNYMIQYVYTLNQDESKPHIIIELPSGNTLNSDGTWAKDNKSKKVETGKFYKVRASYENRFDLFN